MMIKLGMNTVKTRLALGIATCHLDSVILNKSCRQKRWVDVAFS